MLLRAVIDLACFIVVWRQRGQNTRRTCCSYALQPVLYAVFGNTFTINYIKAAQLALHITNCLRSASARRTNQISKRYCYWIVCRQCFSIRGCRSCVVLVASLGLPCAQRAMVRRAIVKSVLCQSSFYILDYGETHLSLL
ncbi:unnamed protein product [Phytomonas sp. EM1]|nr:unnamed protein product [Phytomonas sp. EM1]|eukprot:CCW63346.1 unnamed protein product [Phytomonas sp. isolate EM1]